MALADDIAVRMNGCICKAGANYWLAYGLLAIAVIASSASSIFVAADMGPKELSAALAATPGIIAVVTGTFRFAARAEWWWEKFHGLDSLYRELHYEGRSERNDSQALTKLIATLNARWAGFGDAPSEKVVCALGAVIGRGRRQPFR